jgi:replicative DNA helicase
MIPPNDIALEEAVLGACMLEKGAYERVQHIVDTISFYKPGHQLIWQAITKIRKSGGIPDLLVINQELRESGKLEEAGGTYALATLTNKVSSSANLEYHARLLQQMKAAREIIRVGGDMAYRGYDTTKDGLETLAWAQSQLQDLSRGVYKKDNTPIQIAWKNTTEALNQPRVTGVLPGFRELDRLAGHLDPGDMTIIAARPGMGKTVLGIDIAMNIAERGQCAAFFSLEMPEEQLMMRIMARNTGIPLHRLRSRSLSHEEWIQLDTPPNVTNLWIDDTAQITPMELAGKVASLKAKHGLDLVVVDYLQIMRGNGERFSNREAEISSISRDLKAIAKQQKVHIIALAQLNREADKRTKPEPKLSDLRESGSIEQDADNVWFIYRPEYYAEEKSNKTDTLQIGNTGIYVPMRGHATIICDKFRNGGKFRAYLRCDLEKMRFFDGPEGYGRESLMFDERNYPDILGDKQQQEIIF